MPSNFMTFFIIGLTVVISLLAFSNQRVLNSFIFYPHRILHKKTYQEFLTHGFIHNNYMHLIFNMMTLFFFGGVVERLFTQKFGESTGRIVFLLVYLSAVIIAAIPSFIKHKNNKYYRSLGASGATSAILFASILVNPLNTIMIMPIPIPIPAWLFGPLYLGYSAYMAKQARDNIGHDAHFVGAIYGLVVTTILVPEIFGHFLEQITKAL